jgi:hypothetical protein
MLLLGKIAVCLGLLVMAYGVAMIVKTKRGKVSTHNESRMEELGGDAVLWGLGVIATGCVLWLIGSI